MCAPAFPSSRSSAAPTLRTRSANLRGLRQAMPKSRIVVVPNQGHAIGQYGCLPELIARFIERGSAASLDVSCARKIAPAEFALR